MKSFSVGIITFNSEKYIEELLDSIQSSTVKPESIVIVDNDSQDKTIALISKYNKKLPIKLIRNKTNQGHSPAMNQVLRSSKSRYVVLQDHDTVVEADCYQKLLEQLSKDKGNLFAVTAVIDTVSKYGGKRVFGQDLHYLISSVPRFEYIEEEVGICPTTCVMVDKEKLGELSFDETMFIYQNDYDFFYRARTRGLTLAVCKDAFVLHKDGTPSVSGRKGQKYSALRSFYINRNRWLFYFKNYSLGTLLLLSPALVIYEMMAFIFTLAKGNLRAYIRAKLDFFSNIPKYVKMRAEVQKLRISPDLAIISHGKMGLSESASLGKSDSLIRSINEAFDQYLILIKKVLGTLR